LKNFVARLRKNVSDKFPIPFFVVCQQNHILPINKRRVLS